MTQANLDPVDRETLKNVILGGLAAGMFGLVALLLAEVEPTTEFFVVMGAAVAILSFFVDNQHAKTDDTESRPTFG